MSYVVAIGLCLAYGLWMIRRIRYDRWMLERQQRAQALREAMRRMVMLNRQVVFTMHGFNRALQEARDAIVAAEKIAESARQLGQR